MQNGKGKQKKKQPLQQKRSTIPKQRGRRAANQFALSTKVSSIRNAPVGRSVTNSGYGENALRIRKRERFAEINFSTTTEIKTFPISAGGTHGIWLSHLSDLFEKVIVHKLTFDWVPMCSTATEGQVVLSFDYDPNDVSPSTVHALELNKATTSSSVWDVAKLPLDVRQMFMNTFYTRASLSETGDKRFSDFGQLHVGNSGIPIDKAVGKLYVDYDISFVSPQWPAQIAYSDFLIVSDSTTGNGNNPFTHASGNKVLQHTKDPTIKVGVEVKNGTTDRILIDGPPGLYEVEFNIEGTGLSVWQLVVEYGLEGLAQVQGVYNAAQTVMTAIWHFRKATWYDVGAFSFANTLTTLTALAMRVNKIANHIEQVEVVDYYEDL